MASVAHIDAVSSYALTGRSVLPFETPRKTANQRQFKSLFSIQSLPVVIVVMPAEGCQKPIRARQGIHKRHIVAGFVVIHAALPPNHFPVRAWFSAGVDTWLFLEIICCSYGDVKKGKRGNGLVVMMNEMGIRLLEPIDDLSTVSRTQDIRKRGPSLPICQPNHEGQFHLYCQRTTE